MYINKSCGKYSLRISTNARRKFWNDVRYTKHWNSRHFVWWKLSIHVQWDYDCSECQDSEDGSCQECCPHNEYDHYICMDCGYEKCPGEDIDAAMDYMEDR